jgi:hypothetical protein
VLGIYRLTLEIEFARRNGHHLFTSMKSAYELAMERLQKSEPAKLLNDDQKRQIAEIDETFKAKIAEREVFLQDQINKALKGGSSDEAADLQKQLTAEVRRLRADCEEKKEKLRASFV